MVTVRPAFWTACTAFITISREAATSIPRRMRPPDSWVNSSRVKKSSTACSTGMGTKSCTWKPSDFFSSSSGSHGKVDLAHDDLLVGHPDDDLLAAELRVGPELLDGFTHGDGVDDLAVTDGTLRKSNLAELLEGDFALPNESSAARTPDVPMSRPMADRPATTPTFREAAPAAVNRPDGRVSGRIGLYGARLEHSGLFMAGTTTPNRSTTEDSAVPVRDGLPEEDGEEGPDDHVRPVRDLGFAPGPT